jgi:hypothetical protein
MIDRGVCHVHATRLEAHQDATRSCVRSLESRNDSFDMDVGESMLNDVGVEALLLGAEDCDDVDEFDMDRVRWSARRMSSKLTLFAFLVARHMRLSS